MSSVLVIGCGDLGGEVARLLNQSGNQVTGVRASDKALPDAIACIRADVKNMESLQKIESIKPNILIYSVAANAQTDESYYQHYVLGLQNVMAIQKGNALLKHVIFVSSSRVYGQAGLQNQVETFDENSQAIPSDFGGKRLLEAEDFVRSLPIAHTILRLSGIYGKGRFYLMNMAKTPSSWPAQNNWSNRIHRDDAARFMTYLVEKINSSQSVADSYIVTDDMPVLQYEVLMWLAKKMQINIEDLNVPQTQAGKKLTNARLKSTGFQLSYPNYQFGYQALLQNV